MPRPGQGLMLLALAATVGLAGAGPAPTVAPKPATGAPDLRGVQDSIKAKDYKAALAALQAMLDKGVAHADVYNLVGFSYRKSGDYKQAATFYAKALDLDGNHKGALEYQGEMYVELGQIEKARANLARLVALCPQGCEEREDLEKAIAAAAKAK